MSEAATIRPIESAEPLHEAVGYGRLAEGSGNRLRHSRVAQRVEPHMRVGGSLTVLTGRGTELLPPEEVDGRPTPLLERMLERRLEPGAEVEDEVGVLHRLRIAGGELEVVRLGTGRSEVRHRDTVAADLLRQVREWVEGRNHPLRARSALVRRATAGQNGCRHNENDSRKHRGEISTSLRIAIIKWVPGPATSPWSDHALGGLRAAGLRSGGARRAVVDYLGRQSCCASAQEIFDGIRKQGDNVGIASVYRALDTLAEHRLVQRVDVGDGVARFEPAWPDGHHHHHHLVCEDCGRVEPFSDEPLERALARVAGKLGYEFDAHEVVLRGACGDCR
jgi:Fur family transcriptional regulator, ferric uptake regulator